MKVPLDPGDYRAKFHWASSSSSWDMFIWILRKFAKLGHQNMRAFVWEALCGNKELTTRLDRRALQFSPFFVVTNFGISLWANELELRLDIWDASTEFHPLSHHLDEFPVDHLTMPWHSMNQSVTQVWHLQRGAPLNCNALGKCWFLRNEMEKILEIWRKCPSTSC